MKKLLLAIIPILFIFTIFQGCSKDELNVKGRTSLADELVASEEFQKMFLEMERQTNNIKNNYAKLSELDKNSFKEKYVRIVQ